MTNEDVVEFARKAGWIIPREQAEAFCQISRDGTNAIVEGDQVLAAVKMGELIALDGVTKP